MEWTGERYLPTLPDADISYEHWHRYLHAAAFVAEKAVLDVASGEGYGSHLLARTARQVVGVDRCAEAVRHAAARYARPNLEFLQGDAVAIPIPGEQRFDVVVSFETIEHLDAEGQARFLGEVKRLLRCGGVFLVSTPNKFHYTDRPSYHNAFHLREFYLPEFKEFLARYFRHAHYLAQKVYPVSYLWPIDRPAGPSLEYQLNYANGQYGPTAADAKEVLYVLAICSDTPLDLPNGSLMVDVTAQAIHQRVVQLEEKGRRNQALTSALSQVRAELEEKEQQNRALAAALEQTRGELEKRGLRLAGLGTAPERFPTSLAGEEGKDHDSSTVPAPDQTRGAVDASESNVRADHVGTEDRFSGAGDMDLKVIAFYLPQFHPIPENDSWWGRGFTEWTNVTRARPLFRGHYQPHLPADLGFYDLRVPEVRWQQVELARRYGIHGFCYYYYWFSGRRILERPLNDFVADRDLNFPFCICWANEPWSRRWDGLDQEVLLPQAHDFEIDSHFLEDVLPLLRDPRYVRVGGAPLLLVYRPGLLSQPDLLADRWRRLARRNGIPELHLCAIESFLNQTTDPGTVGFDSAVEFPPHGLALREIPDEPEWFYPVSEAQVFDYEAVIQESLRRALPPYRLFRAAFPSWDNTARRGPRAKLFANSGPEPFQRWLAGLADITRQQQPPGERFLFVNSWNEWAEGAHLEPDQRHGHRFLEAVRQVVTGLGRDRAETAVLADNSAPRPHDACGVDQWSERPEEYAMLSPEQELRAHVRSLQRQLADRDEEIAQLSVELRQARQDNRPSQPPRRASRLLKQLHRWTRARW